MTRENGANEGDTVVGTVRRPPRAKPYGNRRSYLTEREVEQLIAAAENRGRHGHRDATMILVAYRHGLRVSELVNLRWDAIDFDERLMHVARLKHSEASRQPLSRIEMQRLRVLHDDRGPSERLVFRGERGPISARGFAQMLTRAAASIDFPLKVHPHMLRHACGYKLANDGRDTRAIQDYLGHKQIQHTVRYTKLNSTRFQGFWSD